MSPKDEAVFAGQEVNGGGLTQFIVDIPGGERNKAVMDLVRSEIAEVFDASASTRPRPCLRQRTRSIASNG